MALYKPSHNGKYPARLWNILQHTKAFIRTSFAKGTRGPAVGAAIFGGLTGGAGWIIGSAVTAATFTFMGMLLPIGVGVVGLVGTLSSIGAIRSSSTYQDFMRKRYDAWLDKKCGPSLKRRVAALFTRSISGIGYLATLGGLGFAGVQWVGLLGPTIAVGASSLTIPAITACIIAGVGITAALICRHATNKLLGRKSGAEKTQSRNVTLHSSGPEKPSKLSLLKSINSVFKSKVKNTETTVSAVEKAQEFKNSQ